MKRFGIVLLIFVGVFTSFVPSQSFAQTPLCFNVPGITNCVEGRFRSYWEQNGGLPVFGFPMTLAGQAFNVDAGQSYLTQYFERNRFEHYPDNPAPYDVLLGRLGDDRLKQQGRDWRTFPKGTQAPGCLWFAETAHSVCEPFKSYWESHGLQDPALNQYARSLALFGLPLSEPAMETNASGDNVLTQWFERARFEYHPNNPAAFRVLLGLLGNETRPGTQTQTGLIGDVLYPCSNGLCKVSLQTGQTRVVVPLALNDTVLFGYAKTADGQRIVYATGKPTRSGDYADVYVASRDGENPRLLRRVSSLANGTGGPAGYGVIGITVDGNNYVYEDRAQIFISPFNSGQQRPVTPVLRYGASTTHKIVSSPTGSRLLYIASLPFPRIPIYTVADGLEKTVILDPFLSPAFWGRDDNHVIAYRFNRPYDPEASNAANYDRLDTGVIGYTEVDLSTGQTKDLAIDPAFRPVLSGTGGYTILARAEGELALFNSVLGATQLVSLPGFSLEADGRSGF